VFTGALDVLGNSTAGSNLKLYEDTDNGTNYVSFKAPDTIASNVTWTLPSADGTSAQVLSTDGSGALSFATVAASQWTTNTTRIYYNSGNVGIGTSSPVAKLELVDTSAGASTYPLLLTNVGGSSTSSGVGINFDAFDASGTTPTGRIENVRDASGGYSLRFSQFLTSSLEESFRISKTASLILKGGTTNPTGVGITFPATQSASTDANTLDDYEEGTWTPTSSTGGWTFSIDDAQYVKIGKQVSVWASITNTGSGNGSQIVIGGLPFSVPANCYAVSVFDTGGNSKTGSYIRANGNGTLAYAWYVTTSRQSLLGTDISSSSYILFNWTYFV
jgi:hypothetical protein